MLRIVAVVWAALSLSACAVVSSDRPLFSPLDAAGAPILKPGLWAMPVGDCTFSMRGSALKWPDCANGAYVGPSALVGGKRDTSGAFSEALTYRMAVGDPAILQIEAPADRAPGDPKVFYLGVRPLASDGDGRVTKARLWLALCAKPPQTDAGNPRPAKLPVGLTAIKGREECLARTQTAVRNAASQSEAWAFGGDGEDFGLVARWIRDGDR
ncbi:hypothetical protein [Phenylobacterium sp.]|uniref:hypothetical protein n=1 Tax=Phenylobacterium sp. TaxID=1871053 RepID=UPI00286E7484|nr:hypothetical protein [Phenylobacterium sp.]